MNVKIILYFITCIIVLWSLNGVRLNEIFKKGRIIESRILYIFIAFSISYLVVNFIYDFIHF